MRPNATSGCQRLGSPSSASSGRGWRSNGVTAWVLAVLPLTILATALSWLPYVEAALDGGLTLLQYRDKSNDDARCSASPGAGIRWWHSAAWPGVSSSVSIPVVVAGAVMV